MTKLETVKRFKSAAEIEQGAMQQAQALADTTAAEMLALAESMTTITTEMRESYMKAGKAAVASAQAARESVKQTESVAHLIERVLGKLVEEVQESRSQTGRYLELFVVVVLSATVASVCQHWLARF